MCETRGVSAVFWIVISYFFTRSYMLEWAILYLMRTFVLTDAQNLTATFMIVVHHRVMCCFTMLIQVA